MEKEAEQSRPVGEQEMMEKPPRTREHRASNIKAQSKDKLITVQRCDSDSFTICGRNLNSTLHKVPLKCPVFVKTVLVNNSPSAVRTADKLTAS